MTQPNPPASAPTSSRFFRIARNLSFVALLALPGLSFAEIDPSTDGEENPTPDLVRLSPFEVSAGSEVGYIATDTLAGTRFNTALKDTPVSISVLTPEFLRDIGVTELKTALDYSMNTEIDQLDFTGNGTQTADVSVKMRGLRGASLGRNFFQWNLSSDTYNVERYTFTRGPNAVIFGIGGPGGIIDTSTKRALFNKPLTDLSVRYGSYDDKRTTVDINRQLGNKFAARLNAVWQDREGARDFEFHERKGVALAATLRPWVNTTVRFDGEYGEVNELEAMPWPAFDNVSPWLDAGRPASEVFGQAVAGTVNNSATNPVVIQNSGMALRLNGSRNTAAPPGGSTPGARVNFQDEHLLDFDRYLGGSAATSPNEFHNWAVFIEQRIGEDIVIEAAINVQNDWRRWDRPMNWQDIALRADPNRQLPDGTENPYFGEYYTESRAEYNLFEREYEDFRLSGAYSKDLGVGGDHELAAVLSRRDESDFSSFWRGADTTNPANRNLRNGANWIVRRTYLSLDRSGSLPLGQLSPYNTPVENVNGITSRFYKDTENNSLSRLDSQLVAVQSKFWDDRIITTVGFRRDKQRAWGTVNTRDAMTGEATSAVRASTYGLSEGDTRTLGAVFHVNERVSVFYNNANNFVPQVRSRFQVDGPTRADPLGIREGTGWDAGVRLTLLEGRLIGTAAYFETVEGNAFRGKNAYYGNAFTAIARALDDDVDRVDGDDTSDTEANGWEVEFVANLTPNWRLFANLNKTELVGANTFPRMREYIAANLDRWQANREVSTPGGGDLLPTVGQNVDSILSSIDFDTAGDGVSTLHHREKAANFYTNYNFVASPLDGFSVGFGANYRGNMTIGYTANNQPIHAGAFTLFNGNITYRRTLALAGRNVEWSIQLNVNNLLDEDDLVPTEANETRVFRVNFQQPRTWYLTNRFSF